MTRDDIIRIAEEAGVHEGGAANWVDGNRWERFAALVAATEREVCADIAENWRCNGMPRYGVAEAIRARGQDV